MLGALLLAGIVAAPLSTAALFAPLRRPRAVTGAWPTIRRLVRAAAGTVAVAVAVYAVLFAVGEREPLAATIVVPTSVFVVASLAWLPVTRRWNARAHLTWASSLFLFLAYLAFVLVWTVSSGLGFWGTVGGLLLWVFEVLAAFMAAAYLWELCDSLGTENWRRRVSAERIYLGSHAFGSHTVAGIPGAPPMVSLHVPAHNEPPDMVIETLRSLKRLDYPRYEIIAIDDNTDDETLWRPVEAWCQRHAVKFTHLSKWPGYKSGALNYALGECADPDAEIIGVVDSDYQIDSAFLRRCVPLFADPRVGFIQAPQDYRDWHASAYLRRLYYSYRYFFAVSQPSRNERDGAIFAGTMGLIRREAIVGVGGWDEWCITEDAELSLRLLKAGWSGLHVDASMGRGVMPLTFEALKSQRYRWCFGGIQILREHIRSLLPGPRTTDNHLKAGQRWAYLSGALQWYGDLLGLVFFAFLLAGAVNLVLGGEQLFRKLSAFLVATVPVLIVLGLARAVALLRRGTGAKWREAIGAFFIWQSTSLVVARASVQALFARRAEFLRTPKVAEHATVWRVVRANWAESLLALLGLAGIAASLTRLDTYSGPLLAALLLVPTLGMAAAPVNSFAAQHAMLPPTLAARRRSEWQRDRRAIVAGSTAGFATLAAIVLIAAIATLLTAPSPHLQPPSLRPPTRPAPTTGGPTPSGTPTPSPTGSPGGSTTTTPSAPGSTSSGAGGGPSGSAPPDTAPPGTGTPGATATAGTTPGGVAPGNLPQGGVPSGAQAGPTPAAS